MTSTDMSAAERCRKAAEQYIEKMLLPSEPLRPIWNRENFIFSKPAKWNYIDGCMVLAALKLWELRGDGRLLDFAVRFTEAYVREDGTIPTMRWEDFNLDNLNGGKNLIFLWKATGSERFRLGFEKLWEEQVLRQPRLSCGSFWHKAIYPHQMWLDGAYMALPFMAEYGILHADESIIGDVLRQLSNIRNIMRNGDTGLYCHGFDETRSQCWADPVTGLSPEFWLRSMGWLCAGLADVCELLPGEEQCCTMLRELLKSLSRCCQEDGMLLQLPARPELGGNYPETSGTLLFAYSAMKAERLGICSSGQAGERALMTAAERYISLEGEFPVLRNICLMGGLGGEQQRDGSAQYYLSERIVENDAKGIAPFLMAYAEAIRSGGTKDVE